MKSYDQLDQQQIAAEMNNRKQSFPYYSVEHIRGQEMTIKISDKIADFYRNVFDNQNARHFLVDSETMEFRSPSDVFPLSAQNEWGEVIQKIRDELSTKDFPLSDSGNKMIRWHDPDRTKHVFREKFKDIDGVHATILLNEETGQIEGGIVFFKKTLRDLFEIEWKDPLNYSNSWGNQEYFRCFEYFFEKVKSVIRDISTDDEVFCLDFLALSPQAQQMRKTPMLLKVAIKALRNENQDTFLIAETKPHSAARKLFKKRCNFKSIMEFEDIRGGGINDILEISSLRDYVAGLSFLDRSKQHTEQAQS